MSDKDTMVGTTDRLTGNDALNGAKMVAQAILGDYRFVSLGRRIYTIPSPTIYRLSGAIRHLSDIHDGSTIKDALRTIGDMRKYALALSWLIQGDESLADDIERTATPAEAVTAIESALTLIDIAVFQKAVTLPKFVAKLAANSTR